MQVALETVEGLQRRLTVEVPAERIESQIQERIKELTPKAKVDGFRPGKVPARVIEQNYGRQVREEVIGEMMMASFREAIEQADIKPASMPAFEATSQLAGEPLQYVATFEVFPEITLKTLDDIDVETVTAEIQDSNIDEVLEKLRHQFVEWIAVERPVQKGDKVVIDFVGTLDGVAFDGGTANGVDLEIGSGRMIPGFEDGIIGAQLNTTIDVPVTFPEDYHEASLAGKAVSFAITVNELSEAKLPEIDAAFAEKVGVADKTVEGIRKDVLANMQRALKNAIQSKNKENVFKKWAELHDFLLPKAMVDDELRTMAARMFRLKQDDSKLDSLIDIVRQHAGAEAEQRVRLGVLIGEYVRVNDLKANEEQIKDKVIELASSYENPAEVVQWYLKNPQHLQEIHAVLLEDMVLTQLMAQAKVTEVTVNYEELMNKEGA